ncbi:hypothetical protein G7Y89_g13055 [Cudoniella acicularis]|uniref:Major facilitator superfamily (MFS) profile domain-containing protein n=1 Tax=Cudoniella acicularis TaxID=354080 RepID=A0A8H4R991_9HELO|nr:hypothetical protein G7Y89_g13055 [Cudoniella acicularis]
MSSPGLKPTKGTFQLAGREFPRITWWKDPNLRILYFYILALIVTNTANGFDGSMMNGLQSLTYWQDYFGHPTGSKLGLFNCIMSVGSLVGLPLLPSLLDRYGRKSGIVVGSILMLVGIALQSGAVNFSMFIAARFLIGVGDVAAVTTAPLLIAEIAHVQDRAVLVTLCAISYYSGAFIAAWSTYGTLKINVSNSRFYNFPSNTTQSDWAWRAPSVIQGVFTVFMLAIVWFVPESPRFYISTDQPEKALNMLAHYHANGNQDDEIVQLEFAEINSAIAMDKIAGDKSSWLDFVRTPGNRKRLVLLLAIGFFSQWSGNGLVSYYLNLIMDSIGITDPNTQLILNGGLTTWNLVTNTIFAFYVDKFGRRMIYMVSTIGTLIAFTIWTILSAKYADTQKSGLGTGVVVMIFIYYFFYNVK